MPDAPEETVADTDVVETTPEDTADTTDESDEQPKKPTETVEFWKAKAREQEKRAKENDRAAKKLLEIEEAQKTELQRWQERAESAEGAISALQAAQEIRDAKDALSKQYGIPSEALRGSDFDELEEHAKLLKNLLPEPPTPGQVRAEGRTVNAGNNDPAQQFANIITNARRG
jgi:hypothetical protein